MVGQEKPTADGRRSTQIGNRRGVAYLPSPAGRTRVQPICRSANFAIETLGS